MSFRGNRRAFALRPVHSQKHEITWSNLSQDAGSSPITVILVQGVDAGDINIGQEVVIGATVKWIYIEFNFSAETITNTKVMHWKVEKLPFGTADSNPNTYNQSDKRFILKRGMEMLPKDVSTIFKRIVIVPIPPRLRRIGESDQIIFTYQSSSTETINACGFAIYKALN